MAFVDQEQIAARLLTKVFLEKVVTDPLDTSNPDAIVKMFQSHAQLAKLVLHLTLISNISNMLMLI